MKARVLYSGAFWYGEVYGTWENIFGGKRTEWRQVTGPCFTKFGAKLELQKWKKENVAEEFDI